MFVYMTGLCHYISTEYLKYLSSMKTQASVHEIGNEHVHNRVNYLRFIYIGHFLYGIYLSVCVCASSKLVRPKKNNEDGKNGFRKRTQPRFSSVVVAEHNSLTWALDLRSLSLHIGRMGGGYACTSNRTFMRHTNRTKNAGAYANTTHARERERNGTTNALCRMHRRQHPKRFMFTSLPLSPLLLTLLLLLPATVLRYAHAQPDIYDACRERNLYTETA